MRPILAVRSIGIKDIGPFQGFRDNSGDYLDLLFDRGYGCVVDRDLVEENEDYKQIIPYAIIRSKDDKILRYIRGVSGGEARLHNLYSIGIGGHVDVLENDVPRVGLVHLAASREIEEEVGVVPIKLSVVGLVNDDSNSVGRVHLGVVYEVYLDNISAVEDCIEGAVFVEPGLLKEDREHFERWSQIAIDALLG